MNTAADPALRAALLRSIGELAHMLLEAEADYICGAPRHIHTEQRINYRAGYHSRRIRFIIGDVPVRVPHLRWHHVRPGMCKRFKRLEPLLVETLTASLRYGTQLPRIAELVQQLWTLSLTPAFHANLAAQAVMLLEKSHAEYVQSGTGCQPVGSNGSAHAGESPVLNNRQAHGRVAHATQPAQPQAVETPASTLTGIAAPSFAYAVY